MQISQLHDNVHQIKFSGDKTENGKPFERWVMLSSDVHWDNPHCNRRLYKQHLDKAKERGAAVIDVGDWFCAMQARGDRRATYDDLREEHKGTDYIDRLLNTGEKFLAPYADLFAVMGTGNHESSVLKHHNTHLTRNLTTRLQRHTDTGGPFQGGYGGYVFLSFVLSKTQRIKYKLKYFHGSGGGGPVTKGVIQTNRRAVFMPDADFIVTGHIHEGWVLPIKQERVTQQGRIHLRNQWHISTPTYKEEYADGFSGFHVESGRPPKPLGCVWLRFWWGGRKDGMQVDIMPDFH